MKRLPIKPKDFMALIDDKILDLLLTELISSKGEYLNEVVCKLKTLVEHDVKALASKLPVLDEQDKDDLPALLLFQLLKGKDLYRENPRYWIYNNLKIVVHEIVNEKRKRRNAKTFYFDVQDDGLIADEIGRNYYCSPTVSNDSITEVREDRRVNERQDISFDKRNKKNGGQGR